MPLISSWKKCPKNDIIFCRKSREKGNRYERYIYGYCKSYVKRAGYYSKRIRELLDLQNGDYVTFVVNKDKVQIQNSKTFIEENIDK